MTGAMAVMTICVVSGCTGGSPSDDLDAAHSLLEAGDVKSAQEICDDLLARSDSNDIGVSNYGRLSLTYMELAEQADQDDNIVNATLSYYRAYNIDADSAAAYYNALTGDDAMRYSMLATIINSPEIPFDSVGYGESYFEESYCPDSEF